MEELTKELENLTLKILNEKISELKTKADAMAQVFGPNDDIVKKLDKQVRKAEMNLLDLMTISQKIWALKNHPQTEN